MYGAFGAEEEQLSRLGNDRTPGYYTRELIQALPQVKKLAEHHKIKISLYDWTNDMLNAADDRDWFLETGARYDPTAMARRKFHKVFRHHNEMVHKGKRVGFVYGVDKPRLLRDDHSIYFSFLDSIMPRGAMQTNDILGECWENDEYFYWSPNLPELLIKQGHMVVRWLTTFNKLNLIPHIDNCESGHSEEYYREVNRCIYADWDTNTWQIKKPTSDVYDQVGRWFLESATDSRIKWESSLGELERICGTKWFNNNSVNNGFVGCLSAFYKLTSYKLNV
jgi:hypothetical protein